MRDLAADRADDARIFRQALTLDPYDDEQKVEAATSAAMGLVGGILQVFRLDVSDLVHTDKLLKAFNPPYGARVLDAGCGVGAPASFMHSLRQDLNFTLLNISLHQLDLCPDGFEKLHASAHDIPAPDGSFDAVMALYSIGHLLPQRMMQEFSRVLRPGGVLFIWDVASINGENLFVETLGYRPHVPARLFDEAKASGLCLPVIATPTGDPRIFNSFLGERSEEIMGDVYPIWYRFVKDVA